ncbi:MAG: hypothetical protein QXO27_04080 [Candidatus Aenigmatarchaeota archaeon]
MPTKIKAKNIRIGEIAFFAGVILAIIIGLFPTALKNYQNTVAAILVILGLIVGFLNVGKGETFNFLIAAIALMLAGTGGLDALPWISGIIPSILTNIVSFVTPAAIVVGLKAIYDLASKK